MPDHRAERVTKDDAKKAARYAGVEWTDAWTPYDSIAKGQADVLVSRIDCQQLAAPIASFNPRKSDLMKLQVHTPGPLKHEPEARQAMKRRATAVAGAPPAMPGKKAAAAAPSAKEESAATKLQAIQRKRATILDMQTRRAPQARARAAARARALELSLTARARARARAIRRSTSPWSSPWSARMSTSAASSAKSSGTRPSS